MRTEEEIRKEIEVMDARYKELQDEGKTVIADWAKARMWALKWVLDEVE